MKYLLIVCPVFIFIACHTAAEKSEYRYFFSIKNFFEQEAISLTKAGKIIQKTVINNQHSQNKDILIQNWGSEFNIFIASDINKPAWKDLYSILEDAEHIAYYALDSRLRTRHIRIKKNTSGKVLRIDIMNEIKNLLYQSSEHLTYIPDSIYSINKHEYIILIGNNQYQISGKFN